MFSIPQNDPLEEACRLLAQTTWVLDDEAPELCEEVTEFLVAQGQCLDCGGPGDADDDRHGEPRPVVIIISM